MSPTLPTPRVEVSWAFLGKAGYIIVQHTEDLAVALQEFQRDAPALFQSAELTGARIYHLDGREEFIEKPARAERIAEPMMACHECLTRPAVAWVDLGQFVMGRASNLSAACIPCTDWLIEHSAGGYVKAFVSQNSGRAFFETIIRRAGEEPESWATDLEGRNVQFEHGKPTRPAVSSARRRNPSH